ncbi:11970_t:CDS:2 [Funneliformis geosporum]|nr:11970_t:CDS:2 [Funneliformis geosporum]
MPSKSAIQKKLERNRSFRTERKTKNLQEQLAHLRFFLRLEEQKRLLADELLEVHQNSQELREELEDRNNTILLLRNCEEELLDPKSKSTGYKLAGTVILQECFGGKNYC